MKTCRRIVLVTALLLLSVATGCSGQVTAPQPQQIQEAVHGLPRMVRTQGIASGSVGCIPQNREGHTWFGSYKLYNLRIFAP